MSTKDIVINRDLENDVIYIIKKDINKATTFNHTLTPEILIRLDRKTRKIAGFTIENFSKIMPDFANAKEWELMEAFDGIIEFLEASHLIPA